MHNLTYPNRHFGRPLQRAVAEALWRGDYYSQTELAGRYGYSDKQLSNYIHGRSLPDRRDLRLAELVPEIEELMALDRLDAWACSQEYDPGFVVALAHRLANRAAAVA